MRRSSRESTAAGWIAKRWVVLCVLPIVVACLYGCVPGEKSGRGFRLPDGDAEAGRSAFVSLSCHSCHTVSGEDFGEPPVVGPVMVALGGETTRVKNYGQLVTSIINPSHRIETVYQQERTAEDGSSMMPTYNETLRVQELIDLVAFLQGTYEVIPPAYEYYPYTYGP